MLLVLFGKTGESVRDNAGVRLRRHRPETTAGAAAADVPLWTPALDTVAGVKLEHNALSHQPQPQQFPHPVMIVVPTTVIDNWTTELNKWGTFSIVYLGKSKEVEGTFDAARRGTVEIVLMSYEQMVSTINPTSTYNLHKTNCNLTNLHRDRNSFYPYGR